MTARGLLAATLALVTLAACSGSEPAPPSEGIAASKIEGTAAPGGVPGGIPITSVGDLLGEYRVAGIDEKQLGGNVGIAVSVDGELLSFEPICAGFIWQVSFEGEALDLTRYREPVPAHEPGEVLPPIRPVCTVGLLPQWRQLAGALDAVTRAQRTPGNAIRLSGGGRSVTLFSQ